MFFISLVDNFENKICNYSHLSTAEKITIRKALDKINNVSIHDLEKRGLVLFPNKTIEADLRGDDEYILSIQGIESDNLIIKTRNIMGFFTVDNAIHVEIHSRFDKNNTQCFFLHYMLQKVCNIAPMVELIKTTRNPFYSFAVYLFPVFLKRALDQGIFRAYVNREHNDSHIRGPIDFIRHLKNNIPFNGKIAYRTREFSHDNPLTQLIRHTIEYISEDTNLHGILNNINDEVSEIRFCTENYHCSERTAIITKNMKPLANSYYSEYENLRKLCLMILYREKNSYGSSSNLPLNGILFDGASLWEEYLYTLLKPQDFKHPKNKEKVDGIHMFEKPSDEESFDKNYRRIYPDFYRKGIGKNGYILDAKYKRLQNGVGREDLYQVVTYMHTMKIDHGGFIYPLEPNQSAVQSEYKLAGYNGYIHVFGVRIPNAEIDYLDFCAQMKTIENELIKHIQNSQQSLIL